MNQPEIQLVFEGLIVSDILTPLHDDCGSAHGVGPVSGMELGIRFARWLTRRLSFVLAGSLLLATAVQAQPADKDPDAWREAYAYSLGMQAYMFGSPWVVMPALRWAYVANPPPNDMTPYAAINHFYHFRKLADASYQGGGGTNNDTLYSTAWLDLSKEPLILSHPNMGDRYFWFQLASMDSEAFGSIGKRRTGSASGSFALVGPGWKGQLPPEIKKVFRSRTDHGFILARTMVDNAKDALVVNKLQDQYKLVPLSLWGKPDAVLPASRDAWKPFDRKTDPLADWKTMNRAMAEDPPEARLAPLLKMFKEIGVGPGLDVEKIDPGYKKGLSRAAVDAQKMLIDINNSKHPFIWTSRNGWDISPPIDEQTGLDDDFLRRAAINFAGVTSYPKVRKPPTISPMPMVPEVSMTVGIRTYFVFRQANCLK